MQTLEATKIAVLVACHNRRQTTINCLDALYSSLIPADVVLDTYLLDDASSDGTSDAVRSRYPAVEIIGGDGSLYWNGGMRRAWIEAASRAHYDFFLLLNDDTQLLAEGLWKMLECADAMGRASIVCGATRSHEQPKVQTYGGYSDDGELLRPDDNFQRCAFFNGNAVLIPQLVFQKVGYLDPAFTHSLGDFDYGIRARKHGVSSYLAADYVGVCEQHNEQPHWMRSETPLVSRLMLLYQPLGCNPFEFFTFERRRSGVPTAVFHFLTLHLRALIPTLWRLKQKQFGASVSDDV